VPTIYRQVTYLLVYLDCTETHAAIILPDPYTTPAPQTVDHPNHLRQRARDRTRTSCNVHLFNIKAGLFLYLDVGVIGQRKYSLLENQNPHISRFQDLSLIDVQVLSILLYTLTFK
jgi:hypothetical protein